MTDITKYKNVSLSHSTYELIDKIRKKMVPDIILSMSSYVLWLKDTYLYLVISVISFLY